jgi:predicted naringenin-chalcone synthase
MPAFINHIVCAVPPNERQQEFLSSLPSWIGGDEVVAKLRQIAASARIETRHTVLETPFSAAGGVGFYRPGEFPGTGERMRRYQKEAPVLAATAIREIQRDRGTLDDVTHLIVTTCTGFYAPGVDIDIVRAFGLNPQVQRTVIGFMGCQAGLVGLRNAKQVIEAQSDAVVLMVNVELCTLHLQQTEKMDRLVSYLLFADGCAASIISGAEHGIRIDECVSHLSLADSERMAWHVEDSGFAMTLDARLPARIRQWLREGEAFAQPSVAEDEFLWAVHPGGRLILDSVQSACGMSDNQMHASREVLRRYGNMSSASIMFILRDILLDSQRSIPKQGRALAFGPGLTVERMEFTRTPVSTRQLHLQRELAAAV